MGEREEARSAGTALRLIRMILASRRLCARWGRSRGGALPGSGGRSGPIKLSVVSVWSATAATRAGKEALKELLDNKLYGSPGSRLVRFLPPSITRNRCRCFVAVVRRCNFASTASRWLSRSAKSSASSRQSPTRFLPLIMAGAPVAVSCTVQPIGSVRICVEADRPVA
jgi:hypothetical protein